MSVHAAFERLVDRAALFGHVAAPDVFDFDPQLGPGFLATGKPEPCRALPPPTAYNTPDMPMDAIGCQAPLGTNYVFVEGSGWQLAEPKPEPKVERPTKAEFVDFAFQRRAEATGRPLPACVLGRWLNTTRLLVRYLLDRPTMPRRARRALAQCDLTDMRCAYDRASLARISYYCESHNRRAYASKQLSTTKGSAR